MAQDSAQQAARRLAATVTLAAQEYSHGVAGGRVVSAAEVEEATLFLEDARRTAALLPDTLASPVAHALDSLLGLVTATADPATVTAWAQAVAMRVARALEVGFEEMPQTARSEPEAAALFAERCASCHGAAGRGDGPAAAGLDPPPADLTDRPALRDQSPIDFYRKVAFGVAGTAMPGFDGQLAPEELAAVAHYATMLRSATSDRDEGREAFEALARAGRVPSVALGPATVDAAGDADLETRLRDAPASLDSAAARAVTAYLRSRPFDPAASRRAAQRAALADARGGLARAMSLAGAAEPEAVARGVLDAYMRFEAVEADVQARDAGLASRIEDRFGTLRTAAASGATQAELRTAHEELLVSLEQAETLLAARTSGTRLFVQSFVLLVREGFEAILILGALIAVVARAGSGERRRDIAWGAWLALGASIVTAVMFEAIFHIGPAQREAMEGVTMLLATVVLFFVAYWLFSKIEVAKWQAFIKQHAERAISSGSAFTLGAVAFLAVYREGVETILFYKALVITADGVGMEAIAGGALVASFVLVALYLAVTRFGLRIPLKPFFAVTSALLLYMAFVFAGKGVAELQEAGLVSATLVRGAPRLPWLGVYPTVPSLALQGSIVLLVAGALVWTFWVSPRRRAAVAAVAARRSP